MVARDPKVPNTPILCHDLAKAYFDYNLELVLNGRMGALVYLVYLIFSCRMVNIVTSNSTPKTYGKYQIFSEKWDGHMFLELQ